MRYHAQLLTFALSIGMASMAMARNTIVLELSGKLMAGSIGDSVHVHVDQGQGDPAIDLDLPLDSDGYYLGYAHIQSAQIDVTTSTACGMAPSDPGYSMIVDNTDKSDTLSGMFVILYCNDHVDCKGIIAGPDLVGTPCKFPQGGSGVWNVNCECDRGPLPFTDHHFRKKDR